MYMKFVEKKCPNCGAGLKFDDNATSVQCEYCSKTYYIQRDEKKYARVDQAHLGDAYNFVDENGKAIVQNFAKVQLVMLIVPFVMFAIIATFIFSTFFGLAKQQTEDMDDHMPDIFDSGSDKKEEEKKTKKIVTEIAQIDDVSLKTFHSTSKQRLQSYDGTCVMEGAGAYKISQSWKEEGVYLLVSNDSKDNILYTVYGQTYKNRKTGKTTTLYAVVKYDDLYLTDSNIVNNDYYGSLDVPSYDFPGTSFNGAYGYESVEIIYNKLIRSKSADYTIEASEGLYKES